MLPTVRTASLVVERLGDEVVVFDTVANQAHTLNRTAALVFTYADGRTSLAGIAARVAEELGTAPDEGVVALAVDQLGRAGLLEGVAPQRGMSRREAVRRLGVAGAAAALLPLVTSIVAPTPAMAASGAPGGCSTVPGTPCSDDDDCCSPLLCVPDDPSDPLSPTRCQADF